MATTRYFIVLVFATLAIKSNVFSQRLEKPGDIPEPLADGRLITSPSNTVGIISQLKLVAGYASNATLTPPEKGFKYVQCAVSYGTWILQIQAETERALSKATSDRRRMRTELEGVKRALYGLLGVRDAEKQIPDQERRRSINRYQEEIADNLRKAATAAGDAQAALTPPRLMLEEMEGALPTEEANSVDDSYCQDNHPIPVGLMHARHRNKAIVLLKEARKHWAAVIQLHQQIQLRVSRDIDQGERPLLQHRIDGFLKEERSTAQELQPAIAPIVQRILKNISILKAIEDAYASQNLVQRYAKMPIISARRNDTEICREYNRMAAETLMFNQKARETLRKGVSQQ